MKNIGFLLCAMIIMIVCGCNSASGPKTTINKDCLTKSDTSCVTEVMVEPTTQPSSDQVTKVIIDNGGR